MSNKEIDKVAKIRKLNNLLRQYGIGGQILLTRSIRSKPKEEIAEIFEKVRTFNDFHRGNNPYSERDFGCFDYKGEKIVWKVDYYSPDMKYGSEDPSDPSKCARTLTIMLDSDWWSNWKIKKYDKNKMYRYFLR